MNLKSCATALFIISIPCLSSSAQAYQYEYLSRSPARYMGDEDYQLMLDAGKAVLENGKNGATKTWKNPKTGNKGIIKIQLSYNDSGLACRRTALLTKAANGLSEKLVFDFCKIDGQWKVKASPAETFSNEDWEIFDKTAQDALDNAKNGEAKTWHNPKTNNSGTFKPLSAKDQGCRTLFLSVGKSKKDTAETTVDVCKRPDGTWEQRK